MKPALGITVLMMAASVASAAGPIEWSKNVKLTERDFRKKAPDSGTDSAHSWVGLEVSWECREAEPRSQVVAIFDPDQSWWRSTTTSIWGGGVEEGLSRSQLENRRTPAERDRDLLRHEQLHFDLTELSARQIRKHLEQHSRVCAVPGSHAEIDAAIADLQREWTAEQSKYDKETDHGANRVKQRQWELRVKREIER
jgi:hypothetical protein